MLEGGKFMNKFTNMEINLTMIPADCKVKDLEKIVSVGSVIDYATDATEKAYNGDVAQSAFRNFLKTGRENFFTSEKIFYEEGRLGFLTPREAVTLYRIDSIIHSVSFIVAFNNIYYRDGKKIPFEFENENALIFANPSIDYMLDKNDAFYAKWLYSNFKSGIKTLKTGLYNGIDNTKARFDFESAIYGAFGVANTTKREYFDKRKTLKK